VSLHALRSTSNELERVLCHVKGQNAPQRIEQHGFSTGLCGRTPRCAQKSTEMAPKLDAPPQLRPSVCSVRRMTVLTQDLFYSTVTFTLFSKVDITFDFDDRM